MKEAALCACFGVLGIHGGHGIAPCVLLFGCPLPLNAKKTGKISQCSENPSWNYYLYKCTPLVMDTDQ
jgi:hypothetical protein